MKYIEDLLGETISNIKPLCNNEGVYELEITFTNNTVLKIDINQGVNSYLNWSIEGDIRC